MTATITYTDLQAGARPAGRWLLGAGQSSPPMIITSREEIGEQLWRHGEDQLAVRMPDADEATWVLVMEVAMARPQALPRSSTVMVDTCLAYGAVEVLTGAGPAAAPSRRRTRRFLGGSGPGAGPAPRRRRSRRAPRDDRRPDHVGSGRP